MISRVLRAVHLRPAAPVEPQGVPPPATLPPLTLSQFATLHCGPQLPGSPLDAHTSLAAAADYLAHAVDALAAAEVPAYGQLAAALRNVVAEEAALRALVRQHRKSDAARTQALASRLAEQLRALPVGNSHFTPLQLQRTVLGGDRPRVETNEVLVELTRCADGTFSLAVYADGTAAPWQGEVGSEDGSKIRTGHPSQWNGLPEALVLGGEADPPLWLRALYELHATPNFEARSLYCTLLGRAQDAGAQPVATEVGAVVTPQRPKHSPWKPLLGLARAYLGEAEYKLFKTRLQISTLRATAPQLPADTTGTLLMQDSVANLKGNLHKLQQRGLLDAAGTAAMLEQVDAVGQAAGPAPLCLPPAQAAVLDDAALGSALALRVRLPKLRFHRGVSPAHAKGTPATSPPPAIVAPTTAAGLLQCLHTCLDYAATGLHEHNAAQVVGCLRDLVHKLPGPGNADDPDNLWNQVDPLSTEELLGDLMAHFESACWQSPQVPDSMAHEQAVSATLFCMLLRQMHRALADYPPLHWTPPDAPAPAYASPGVEETLEAWSSSLPRPPEDVRSDFFGGLGGIGGDNVPFMEEVMARHPELLDPARQLAHAHRNDLHVACESLLRNGLGRDMSLPGPLRAYGLAYRARLLRHLERDWRPGRKTGRGPIELRYDRHGQLRVRAPELARNVHWYDDILTFDRGARAKREAADYENLLLTRGRLPGEQPAESYAIGVSMTFPALQVDSAVSYYSQHLHDLADPAHQGQLWGLLWTWRTRRWRERTLLTPPVLHGTSPEAPTRQRLERLLARALTLYTETQQVQPATFIAALLGQLRDHWDYRGLPHDFVDPSAPLAQLEAAPRSPDEQALLAAAWWANLPYHLDADAMTDTQLLAAQRHALHLAAVAEGKGHNKGEDRERIKHEGVRGLAARLSLSQRAQLHRALAARMQDPAFAAQAMAQLQAVLGGWQLPEASGPWRGTFPVFRCDALSYDMLSGQLTQGKTPIQRLREDAVAQALRRLGLVSEDTPLITQDDDGTWTTADGRVRARWVKRSGHSTSLCVQQRFDFGSDNTGGGSNGWYELADGSTVGTELPQAIGDGQRLWRSSDGSEPTLLWTRANQVRYTARHQALRLQVVDVASGDKLARTAAAPAALAAFAAPANTLVWYRDGHAQRVEVPHRQLRFQVEPDGTLRWPADLRYRVDANALPLFRHSQDLLVLSRDDGARKLILPTDTLHPTPAPAALRTQLEGRPTQGQPYIVVDLLADGALTHPDAAVNLHLAYLYAADGNAERALHHLQRGRSLQPYDEGARHTLEALRQLPFGDPDTLALRAHAAALLADNLGIDVDADIEFTGRWRGCVERYLQVRHNVTPALRLPAFAEAQLLRCFGSATQDRLQQRHQTLEAVARLPEAAVRRHRAAHARTSGDAAALEKLVRDSHRWAPPLATMRVLVDTASTCFCEALRWAMGDEGPSRQAELRERLAYQQPTFAVEVLRRVLDDPSLHPGVRTLMENALNPTHRTDLGPARALLAQLNLAPTAPFVSYEMPHAAWPAAAAATPWPQPPARPARAFCEPTSARSQPLEGLARAYTTVTPRPRDATAPLQALAALAPGAADPLLAEQVVEMAAHVRAHAATPEQAVSLLPDLTADAVLADLAAVEASCDIGARTAALEAFANSDGLPAEARLAYRLATEGRDQSRITVPRMVSLLLQNDLPQLQADNPHLTDDDVQAVRAALIALLLTRSLAQQVQRARAGVQALVALQAPDDSPERRALRAQLAQTLAAPRAYDPQLHPELLVFECAAQLLLRPAQVQALQALLQPERGALPACIFQLAMGVGKTKVLLPLVAQRLADGERLPFVVVPQPLLTTARHDLQHTAQLATQQQGVRFDFERSSDCSELRLERLRTLFDDVRTQRQVVITCRNSIAAFKLQYQDFLLQLGTPELTPELRALRKRQVQLMGDILQTWRHHGVAVLDEADQALDVRAEVNFTTGKPHGLPASHLDVVAALYQALAARPELDLRNNQQSTLRAPAYAALKPELARQVLALPVFAAFTAAEHAALVPYLSEDATPAPAALRAAYAGTPPQRLAAQAVALLREELLHLLPLTLRRNGGEHYGLSRLHSAAPCAIPYSKSEPQERAQFGNEYETLNYTLQTYLHSGQGLTAQTLLTTVRGLCDQATEDMARYGEAMEQTPAAQAFAALAAGSGLTLRDLYSVRDPEDPRAQQLWANLQANAALLLRYVRTYVLPHVQVYDAQLTSDAYDGVDTFAHVLGFTGTPYNRHAYPPQLSTATQPHSDGLVSQALFDPNKAQVHPSAAQTPQALLEDLESAGHGAQLHAIIDAGALWRGLGNVEVARELAAWFAARPERGVRGVLFFAQDGGLALQHVDGTTQQLGRSDPESLARAGLQPHAVFAYYDQAHATGADLPLPPSACGAVTVGELTSMRDLQQGVLRLRHLAGEQRCVVVLPQPLAEQLAPRGSPGMPHLFAHALHNQARALASDKLRAVRQELRAQVRRLAVDRTFGRPVRERTAVLRALRAVLLTPRQDDPFLAFADTQEVPLRASLARTLAHLRQQVRQAAQTLQPTHPEHAAALQALARTWDAPQAVDQLLAPRGALPPTERRAPDASETEQAVMREVEREVAVEVEVQQLRQTRGRIHPAWPGPLHLRPLAAVVPEGVFDADLQVSTNYLRTLDSEASALGGAYQKPVNYILVLHTRAGPRYCAIAASEADLLRREAPAVDWQGAAAPYAVLDQSGELLQRSADLPEAQALPGPGFARALLQLKVLSRSATRELPLTREEEALIATWLQEGTAEHRAHKRSLAYGAAQAWAEVSQSED